MTDQSQRSSRSVSRATNRSVTSTSRTAAKSETVTTFRVGPKSAWSATSSQTNASSTKSKPELKSILKKNGNNSASALGRDVGSGKSQRSSKNTFEDFLKVNKNKLQVLEKSHFFDTLLDTDLEINVKDDHVFLKGKTLQKIDEAKYKINKKAKGVVTRLDNIGNLKSKFLRTPEVVEYVDFMLFHEGTPCSWQVNDKVFDLLVYSINQESAVEAAKTIKNCIQQIEVQNEQIEFIELQHFLSFNNKVKVVPRKKKGDTVLLMTSDEYAKYQRIINGKVGGIPGEENDEMQVLKIPLPNWKIEIFIKFKDLKLKPLCNMYKVDFTVYDDHIELHGKGLEIVRMEIERMSTEFFISLDHTFGNAPALTLSVRDKCAELEEQKHCIISVENKARLHSGWLGNGREAMMHIMTMVGPVETSQCDILVCPVTTDLEPIGRVKDIFLMGGKSIKTDIKKLLKNSEVTETAIETEEIVILQNTGNLKCQLLLLAPHSGRRSLRNLLLTAAVKPLFEIFICCGKYLNYIQNHSAVTMDAGKMEKVTKRKKTTSSPTGYTPNEKIACVSKKKIWKSWLESEKEFICKFVSGSGGQENVNWSNCADKLNATFNSSRSGKACQSLFLRIQDVCSATTTTTIDAEVQTTLSFNPNDDITWNNNSLPKETPDMCIAESVAELYYTAEPIPQLPSNVDLGKESEKEIRIASNDTGSDSYPIHFDDANSSIEIENVWDHGYTRQQQNRKEPFQCGISSHLDLENGAFSHNYSRKARRQLFPSDLTSINFSELLMKYQDNNVSSNATSKLEATEIIKKEIESVSRKHKGHQSVLLSKKSMSTVGDSCTEIFNDIINEMSKRTPFFLHILLTILKKSSRCNDDRIKGAICTIYGITLFCRNPEISGFQRILTTLCIRGRAEDMLFSRLNKLGLTLSARSKQRILEEAALISRKGIVSYLESCPLMKITGDNLDVFVKTSHLAIDIRNRDLHLFTGNAVSVRASTPDMDQKKTILNPDLVTVDSLNLTNNELEKLKRSYVILISRILSEMDAFKWMSSITPTHIRHPYSAAMSEKSLVFQLPIQHKNEAKYEDCIDIMDSYETFLQRVFREAHGTLEMLDRYKVVTGGDQLTKVRMDGAANLRILSGTAAGRFEHLRPNICELWHLKQDFLEKCFKTLYQASSSRQEGTLLFYKNLLKKTDVTGKVKGKYQSHSTFLKLITECMVKEQAMALFGMDNNTSIPDIIPANIHHLPREAKEELRNNIVEQLLDRFHYFYQRNINTEADVIDEDWLFNYCCNLCTWGLHMIELDDTAKEGDVSRVIPNLKRCIPFFYSHSTLSKYLVECIDYITKVEYLLSPLDKLRVLEGSFINTKGGVGNNIEADLVQEHSVRDQKELIKGLGANKSEKAISCVTAAAPTVNSICRLFDISLDITQKSCRHSKKVSVGDKDLIEKNLRKLKPFNFTPNRKCIGFLKINANQTAKIDNNRMGIDLTAILERVKRGNIEINEEDNDVDDDVDDDDDGDDDDDISSNSDDNEELPEI